MGWMILFKKQLFDLKVKGQGSTKVIAVCDTPPYDHAPTYQLSLTYLERQKCYGPDKKILFKKQLFDLEVKGQRRSIRYATHRLMVMHPHTKYHWPISKDKKSYGPDKLRWEEAEEEEKIRLKQYVSLRSKGRHKYLGRTDKRTEVKQYTTLPLRGAGV